MDNRKKAMNPIKSLSSRWLASNTLGIQILGALLKSRWLMLCMLALMALALLTPYEWALRQVLWIASITLLVILTSTTCQTLTNIFNLRRQETHITWCQISILIVIGIWILAFLIIFDIKSDSHYYIALGIIGTLLAWIFQDKVKGVLAFIHLRSHHLLSIDDWIQVPKYDVDGTVTRVTLTTVTIYNWDTTTSTIPINALHSDHFINFQNMMNGNTYGRRMLKTLVLDTTCFHPISANEAEQIKSHVDFRYLPEEEIKEGELNAKLYRIYLYHWMMGHPHVSQRPFLTVRWLDHVEWGLQLQIYAYIMDSGLQAFEWQQSQIIEHIINSLAWFNLRLFQKMSSDDDSSTDQNTEI